MKTDGLFHSIASILVLAPAAASCEGLAASRPVPGDVGEPDGPLGTPVVYELDAEDSEVVDVVATREGLLVHVASPGGSCGEAGEGARIPVLRRPPASGELEDVRTIEPGPGEATSVAAHPSGSFALVAMKDPRRPAAGRGRLVAVGEAGPIGEVAVGPGPDSVAITFDGELAVVACEAEPPDPEDCPEETGAADAEGTIVIVDLRGGPRGMRVLAEVTARDIFERALRGEPARAASPADVEPEYVAIAPDSSFALVTLQEQCAVAVVDLLEARRPREGKAHPASGRCLIDVVLLPHGIADRGGRVRGVHPDAVAISPDGRMALTANEAHPRVRELQGVTVLDLRGGPRDVRALSTHSIFDLDPTLSAPAKESRKPLRSRPRPSRARPARLPRLDPEGVAIAERAGTLLAAVAIERPAAPQPSGSVLFLDLSGVLEGKAPVRVARWQVGSGAGARPETVKFSPDARQLFVACERDGGTLTVIPLR